MHEKNWEDLFENRILSRGIRYCRDGKVANLTISDKKVTALVKGTSTYSVEIDLVDGAPVEMYCTCPYAASGEKCKHMAAVMYAVDPESNRGSKNPDKKEKLKDTHGLDAAHVLDLKAGVDMIFREYGDRSGFIDYFRAMDFQIALEEYLSDNTNTLIDNHFVKEAFDFTSYAFLKLSDADIDDDGEISSITFLCYELWKKILEAASPDEQSEIKECFLKYSKDESVIDYMRDSLISFINEELATDDDRRAKMAELDEIIEKTAGKADCPYSEYGYSHEPAVILRIKLMRMLAYSDDEIEKYRFAHRHYSVIRKQYMDEAESAGDWGKLIALLKQSKILDADSQIKLSSYSDKLIEVYHTIGDKKNEKEERYWAFCNLNKRTIEDYCKIKELCNDDEWQAYKCSMIDKIYERDLLCEIYSSELMLTELYETIFNGRDDKNYAIINRNYIQYFGDDKGLQKARTIKLLDRYGFLLASDYAPDILTAYEAWVRPIAETARSNARYDEIKHYLQRMLHYDGGEELVKSLANEWINTYTTRKVMVQMLERFT